MACFLLLLIIHPVDFNDQLMACFLLLLIIHPVDHPSIQQMVSFQLVNTFLLLLVFHLENQPMAGFRLLLLFLIFYLKDQLMAGFLLLLIIHPIYHPFCQQTVSFQLVNTFRLLLIVSTCLLSPTIISQLMVCFPLVDPNISFPSPMMPSNGQQTACPTIVGLWDLEVVCTCFPLM